MREPLHKFGQDGFAPINRHHHRNAGPSTCVRWNGCHLACRIHPSSPASHGGNAGDDGDEPGYLLRGNLLMQKVERPQRDQRIGKAYEQGIAG